MANRKSAVPAKSQRRRHYATPALEKGLDILELFAREPHTLTVSEVARRLNRTVSEIFRMLVCLERRGYLSQSSEDDRYRLTLLLFKLAQEHPPTKRLISEADPIMHSVAHDLRQSCHLGIIDGASVVIVAQVDSPESPGFYVKLGSRVDLMHAATGHVILAHQSPDAAARAIAEWSRETQKPEPRDLQEHLRRIRRRGHEQRNSYEVSGVTNISVPIFNDQNSAIAGLTVPYVTRLEDNISKEDVLKRLKSASEEMSIALGCTLKH